MDEHNSQNISYGAAPPPAPVMDVRPPEGAVHPAPAEGDPKQPMAHEQKSKKISQAPVSSSKPAKSGSGNGVAIFATVVIVLGLAALVTYAYLKTHGS